VGRARWKMNWVKKTKKEEKIKDGLQGTFGPKSNQAAEQNRKLFSNF
jgi:hypothetical protein